MTAPDPRLDEIEAIPAGSVEAAARVHFERDGGRWDDWTAEDKAVELEDMRAALAAAHPVLLAELRKAHEALTRVESLAERAESHGNLYVFVDDLTSAVAAANGDGETRRNSVPAPPVPSWGELKKGNDGK